MDDPDDDDSSPDSLGFTLSSDGVVHDFDHPTTMNDAIELFMAEGYDSVEHILRCFAQGDAPKEVKDPILRVFARYLHVFREAFIHGLHIDACHVTATNAVMGDPVVVSMIEGFMEVGVQGMVERAVE